MNAGSRIAVIGCPGSGKTTFSLKLGKILGVEVVHLDKLLWLPDWQMMPYEERNVIHKQLIDGESWLIDGMWRSHLESRLQRANVIIFLDYPNLVCRWRAFKRRIKNSGKQRPDIADGCLERRDKYFTHYVRTFKKNVRPEILSLLSKYSDKEIVVFKNSKQADEFLQNLAQSSKNT